MDRLYGYCRKSTEEQNETSFEIKERKKNLKKYNNPVDNYNTFMIEYICKRKGGILPTKKELIKEKLEMEKKKVYKEINGKKVLVYAMGDGDGIPEAWFDYDEKGQLIHDKNSIEEESWYDYDSKGQLIHKKDRDGKAYYEEWYDYDSNGNEIHSKDSEGNEWLYTFDSKGNKVSVCHMNSKGIDRLYTFDSKGNKVSEYNKHINGREEWIVYYPNGKEASLHYKYSNGCERWYDYNSRGREIHEKDNQGFEWFAKGYEARKSC